MVNTQHNLRCCGFERSSTT